MLQEALQVGVPVVATAVGGVPELVGRQRSTGCSPATRTGSRTESGKFFPNPDTATAMRTEGLELASGWPDEDEVAKNLLDIYAGLVATTA